MTILAYNQNFLFVLFVVSKKEHDKIEVEVI